MSDTDQDLDYNPLIDDVATENASDESSQDTDVEEEILALKQRLINTLDRIGDLEGVIEEMETRERELKDSVEILRTTVRRLRFQNQPGDRLRRDNSFFDAARRKFLNRWDGNMEYLSAAQPEHLGFLAALIDLPKE